MMKSLFCILSLAFLLLGVGHISNKDLQGFREEAGIPDYCISLAAFSSADSNSPFFCDNFSEYHTFGILTALSLPRTMVPVKTLKFNAVSTIAYLLSSQAFRLSENRGKNLLSNTNYLKYSNRYYIYTLAHILI